MSSGNINNRLCFGVSPKESSANTYTTEEISGRYSWVLYEDLNEFEWGGFELKTDGTFTYAIGPNDDKYFDGDTFYTSYIILPGEALLFFTWGDNGMVNDGIGSKIN
mgnify:CR=1 FL=1